MRPGIGLMCLALIGTLALAQEPDPQLGGRQCATPEPPPAEVTRATEGARQYIPQSAYFRVERVKFRIPIAFHVIHAQGEGNAPLAQIDAQVRVLNEKLGPFGYQFVRHSVTRTDNAAWHNMIIDESTERDAKHELAVDHTAALNIYIAAPRYWTQDQGGNPLLQNALGIATFPWWLGDAGWNTKLDGVVLDYKVLPGAADWEFDLGYTAVHEVGHWIGLLHTFQGGGALSQARVDGCYPPGDEVADTDYELRAYFGPGKGNQCLAPMASSCPTGGFNPIRNFMDYADDRCMSELTTGQDIRARSMMQAYRSSFVDRSPDVLRFERMREQQ